MKMKQYIFRIIFASAVLFDLSACGAADMTESQVPNDGSYAEADSFIDNNGCTEADGFTDNSGYIEADSYTENIENWNCAWYVYWDADVRDELLLLTEEMEFSSASMFACYFSEDGQLYIPQNFFELRVLAEELAFPVTYLSFTNDVQHSDGSATQKDPEFLRNLWSDVERTEETAAAMFTMTKSMGADGIEIDFENIKDPELWVDFGHFLELIWNKAQAEGLSMRVVLGVGAPVEDLDLPSGPEYSVMCYNLYGTHSGPGPKADSDFLKNIAERFREMQHVTYALATGGFEWDNNGVVTRSLTQEAAEELSEESACEPGRDKYSGALYYAYRDNGRKFTVWYADEQTLAAWRRAILSVDPNAEFDLWRVGGNRWR